MTIIRAGEDIIATPEVRKRIHDHGMPKGYRQVVDFESGPNGQPIPVPKLAPNRTRPLRRNPVTGEVEWKPEYRPGTAVTETVALPDAPPEVRTSARAKYHALVQVLTHEAIRFTQPDGSVAWPASVARDLSEAAWKQGKAGRMTREEQVELLARNYIVWGANKQKENDQRQIAVSWHGHAVA